jgi:RPA family protein
MNDEEKPKQIVRVQNAKFYAVFGDLCDITCTIPIGIEILVAKEGDRIWINDTYGECLVRICNIKQAIEIKDERKKPKKDLTRVKKKITKEDIKKAIAELDQEYTKPD